MNGTESTAAMKTPAPADLQRWSEELARNPGSLAFLPLARAYRRQGRLDLALKLCLAGLEQHPTHVEGHALLALLYLESGDRARAADEWATVLRLKPGNFEALRGMGFRYLEEGDAAKARQHLERAALIRPDDAVVQEALRLLRQRHEEPMSIRERSAEARPASIAEPPPADRFEFEQPEARPEPTAAEPRSESSVQAAPDAPLDEEPWAESPSIAAGAARPTGGTRQGTPATRPAAAPSMAAAPTPEPAPAADPAALFERVMREPPALGVLLLDRRGFLLAGGLKSADGASADDVGALLGNAVEEAVRTATHLELGDWRTLRIEAKTAIVHVVPAGEDALIAVAAKRDTPLGWFMRSAGIAASLATEYLGGAHGE